MKKIIIIIILILVFSGGCSVMINNHSNHPDMTDPLNVGTTISPESGVNIKVKAQL